MDRDARVRALLSLYRYYEGAGSEPRGDDPDPQPGFVWLDTPGKVLHMDERVLEFTDVLPGG